MAVIAHHRLCTRHAEEWIPDENDRVCIFVESLVCDGELVEYVPADQLRGAVEALEAIRKLGAVCDQYETCEHRACRDSYTAWATADQYLGGQ